MDSSNSYYWGNGPPIGDALGCDIGSKGTSPISDKIARPLWDEYRSGARTPFCYDLNDTMALSDADIKSLPQLDQPVEYDHRVATRTIESITRAKSLGKPFFIGAGIRRPHLDWRVPRRFWDLYANVDVELAKHQSLIGANVTDLAYELNGEMGAVFTSQGDGSKHREGPDSPLPTDLQRQARRGYYAAVSFMDFEVGRMLSALKELDLEMTTAVLFHSDRECSLIVFL